MTRTARRGKGKRALPASTWTELKVQHVDEQDELGPSDDAKNLRKVKKNGLKLTKTAKLTSSSMPTKQLLKKLKKKTGKRVLSTHDDITPLLQAPEYDEEVTERTLSSVSRNKHGKSKKEKLSKQKKCRTSEVLDPDSECSHDEGMSDSDQEESTEKSKLLRRQQRQKRLKQKQKRKKRMTSSEDRIPLLQSNSDSSDEADGEDDLPVDEPQPKNKKVKVVELAVDGDSLPSRMESEQSVGAWQQSVGAWQQSVGAWQQSVGAWQKKKGNRKAQLKAGRIDEKLLKRREARRLRRQKTKVCFNCRQPGHQVNDCPQGSATGMCFKCGSADHTSKNCQSKIPEGKYPYAKCFICGEVGHLSKSCPDNPRGLYPQGGGCKVCGSVEHKQADCPGKRRKTHASLVITNKSADAEDFGETKFVSRGSKSRSKPSKHKVVTF